MSYSKNKLRDRAKVEALWTRLLLEWSPVEHADQPTWQKSCKVFESFIQQVEPNRFLFLINSLDDDTIYEQVIVAAVFDTAAKEADNLLFEFLGTACELMGGFQFVRDRPANEVRIQQLCWVEGDLYGIDSEGVVFKKDWAKDGNWTRCNMTREHLPSTN